MRIICDLNLQYAEVNMNAYFEDFSNVRYNEQQRARESATRGLFDRLISFICAIVELVSCPAAIKVEKAVVIFALFIAFFGVSGGIESGSFSWLFGMLLCAAISFVEYVTLKSVFKPIEKN